MTSLADGLRRAFSLVLLPIAAVTLPGCGGGGGGGNNVPTLQSVEVTPANPQAAAGTTQQFAATAILSDGTHQDVTNQVTWASSSTAVAAIASAAPHQGLASAIRAGSTTISASFEGKTGSTDFTVTAASLVSIDVTPSNPTVARGLSKQFTATGTFTDNSTQDLTAQVTWSSSDSSVASISDSAGSKGLAAAGGTGSSTITASKGGVSGSTSLTVTAAVLTSIEVTPPNPSVAKGLKQQFSATGVFSDNSTQDLSKQASWASSNTAVASISNTSGSQGLASTLAPGTATITATSGSISGTTTLTVTAAALSSLQVTPANPSVAKGLKQQFAATGTFTDGSTQNLTNQVTWASSNTAVATVSNAAGSNGLATTVAAGTTTISASSGSVSGGTILTVTAASLSSIQVTPVNPSVAKGVTEQFAATGTFTDGTTKDLTTQVTWGSSNTGIATISNASGLQGLASTAGTGTTTISAVSGSVSGGTTLTVTAATLSSVKVTPVNPSVAKGLSKQFTATGTYSDGSTKDLTAQVTWASSKTGVATVSNASGSQGLASTVGAGVTTISAASGGISGSTTLTVTAVALASIQVTPANPSIANGTTQQFTATGIYTDNTSQDLTGTVTWASSDTAVAQVSNASGSQGLAAASAAGGTTISATSGGVSGSTTLTVTAATLVSIQVTSPSSGVAAGFSLQFTATGVYSDNSTQDITKQVTWVSTNSGAATVSNTSSSNGLAKGVAAGGTTIAAKSGSIQGSKALTVTGATLKSITVTPPGRSLPKGRTLQYAATGTFSDNSSQDLTAQVTWSSTSTTVATISNGVGSQGLATAVATSGTTSIVATSVTSQSGTVTGSATLTATNADLVSLQVSPDTATVAKGVSQQFHAQGTFSDGTSGDATTQVTWSSSAPKVATVSNAAGSQGLASTTGAGTATITAQGTDSAGNPVTATSALTVTAATLQSIAVTPTKRSVPLGVQVQYKATGTYSDNSTNDLTAQVTWASDTTSVATVSNASGSLGLASTLATGSATISATYGAGAVTGSTTLTVTNAALSSIAVTPANPTIGVDSSQQFTATAKYTDNSTQDFTKAVTWSSSNTAVTAISNSSGSQGLAFASTQGQTTIKAVDPASQKSGSTTLTVGAAALQSISISPPTTGAGEVPKDYQEQFHAIGHYADNTTQDLTSSATWNSFNPQVLTIGNDNGNKGLASGVASGTTTITAQVGQFSANKSVSVTAAALTSISVTPADQQVSGPNQEVQYQATGTFSDGFALDLTTQVSWSSSNMAAAVISNAVGSQGHAVSQQVAANTIVTIGAALNGVSGGTSLTVTPGGTLQTITVSPATQSLTGAGQTQQYTATGTWSTGGTLDVTSLVTWSSSNTNAATISNATGSQGLATSQQVLLFSQNTTITATSGSVSGTAALTVNP